MNIEDKYLNEGIDREVYIDDHPEFVKVIGYDEYRGCSNCRYGSGPKDEMECKNTQVKNRLKATTLTLLTLNHKVCNFWKQY